MKMKTPRNRSIPIPLCGNFNRIIHQTRSRDLLICLAALAILATITLTITIITIITITITELFIRQDHGTC